MTLGTKKISSARPHRGKYPLAEKLKILKTLQLNGFNYALTAKQTGASHDSIRLWRKQMPEAFSNDYNSEQLARIERRAGDKAVKLVETAGDVIELALKQANALLEIETDLNKVSNFLRAALPMVKALNGEGENDSGHKQVSAIRATLDKLAFGNFTDAVIIEDEKPL